MVIYTDFLNEHFPEIITIFILSYICGEIIYGLITLYSNFKRIKIGDIYNVQCEEPCKEIPATITKKTNWGVYYRIRTTNGEYVEFYNNMLTFFLMASPYC